LGAPELSFSAGICDLAGACPLVASGIVAAGPVLVPFCWGWGAPELSYCFGVCCCADATPALTSNAMLANTTKCFLMIRSSFFPVLPNLSVVKQPPAEMLVPAAKAQSRGHGAPHPRWRDAVGFYAARRTCCRRLQANAFSGVAEWIRRVKKARFGRNHMFASI
jgi:hypothetical protein